MVHVIAQAWEGAEESQEESCSGRLLIHRLPVEDWTAILPPKPHPSIKGSLAAALFQAGYPPRAFSWQAALLAEQLVVSEGIDLVEAQEYEAPLYDFVLRRLLGEGPNRQPPCLIHLHSPTEFIARFNEWDLNSLPVRMAIQMENTCIAAADALLCPSTTFARQAQDHYNLPDGRIHTIPLPAGEAAYIPRHQSTWTTGNILFLGRLERRKGALEWLQAASMVSRQDPSLRFAFAGSNVLAGNRLSSEAALRELVPPDVRRRFTFYGEVARANLPLVLGQARLVVVPSRWENFPYSCIEAMTSGLPALATCNGGMVEMIEDHRSGWLAPSGEPSELATTLQHALQTPPLNLAEMGRQASLDIQRLCSNQVVLAAHQEFRRMVTGRVPRHFLPAARLARLRIIALPANDSPVTSTAGRPTISEKDETPEALLFVQAGVELDPGFGKKCARVLDLFPKAGLIFCWTLVESRGYNVQVDPRPDISRLTNEECAAPVFVVRASALEQVSGVQISKGSQQEVGELAKHLIRGGWQIFNDPEVLARAPSTVRLVMEAARSEMPGADRRLSMLLLIQNPASAVRAAGWVLGQVGKKAGYRWKAMTRRKEARHR
jgi:glycosyltransferase involved in cell wall biosynthesis